MPILHIPSDAFSHGQIKSKLWLCEHLSNWLQKHLNSSSPYTLHWFGSWVGVGPFLLLALTKKSFKKINLYDLTATDLDISKNLLDYWRCESVEINTYNQDVNTVVVLNDPHQIFVNTACEHIAGSHWLSSIAKGSFVLLQSTDMAHAEHINCPTDLNDFLKKYSDQLEVLDKQQLYFDYPDKKFTRYMLFGIKI